MQIRAWMAWEGGVDVAGMTAPGLAMPNVVIHVARLVHTPVGSAPAGMVLFQPDAQTAPAVMGFVSPDPEVGAYFGPHIFAGTPFAQAPVLPAEITVDADLPHGVASRIRVGEYLFEVTLRELAPAELVQRGPGAMTPFTQQGVEAGATAVTLAVNGAALPLLLPPVGLSGGPAAVWSPCGIYAR